MAAEERERAKRERRCPECGNKVLMLMMVLMLTMLHDGIVDYDYDDWTAGEQRGKDVVLSVETRLMIMMLMIMMLMMRHDVYGGSLYWAKRERRVPECGNKVG